MEPFERRVDAYPPLAGEVVQPPSNGRELQSFALVHEGDDLVIRGSTRFAAGDDSAEISNGTPLLLAPLIPDLAAVLWDALGASHYITLPHGPAAIAHEESAALVHRGLELDLLD